MVIYEGRSAYVAADRNESKIDGEARGEGGADVEQVREEAR